MDDLALHAEGSDPVVCWAGGCMRLDVSSSSAAMVARPPEAKGWLGPVAEVKPDAVCVGTTCKPLGKKLAAAVAEFRKEAATNTYPQFAGATTDLKAVFLGTQLWSVRADRPIKLKPAPTKGDTPAVIGMTAAGELLVVDWTTCAGPCTTMTIMDSTGRIKGREVAGGGPVFQLDAKRFVTISEYADAIVFDLKTGAALGALDLDSEDAAGGVRAVRLDDSSFAVLFARGSGQELVVVGAPSEKGAKVHRSGGMWLPSCTP